MHIAQMVLQKHCAWSRPDRRKGDGKRRRATATEAVHATDDKQAMGECAAEEREKMCSVRAVRVHAWDEWKWIFHLIERCLVWQCEWLSSEMWQR